MTTTVDQAKKPTSTKKRFRPTRKRGLNLLLHVMEQIEAEERSARRREQRTGSRAPSHLSNSWDQGRWAEIYKDAMPEDAAFEVVKAKVDEKETFVRVAPQVTCGTAMCLAGHAVAAVGDRFVDNGLYALSYREGELIPLRSHLSDAFMFEQCMGKEGQVRTIPERAKELLGLSEDDAEALFAYDNDLPTLRKMVKALQRGESIATDD